jgi:hypothetical protein
MPQPAIETLLPCGQAPQQSESQFGGSAIGETLGKPWRSESSWGEPRSNQQTNNQYEVQLTSILMTATSLSSDHESKSGCRMYWSMKKVLPPVNRLVDPPHKLIWNFSFLQWHSPKLEAFDTHRAWRCVEYQAMSSSKSETRTDVACTANVTVESLEHSHLVFSHSLSHQLTLQKLDQWYQDDAESLRFFLGFHRLS